MSRQIKITRTINKRGYVLVYAPDHPASRKRGWVLEHRMVWHDANGPIPKGHVIHHINEDKQDNRIDNLECLTMAEHAMKHWETTSPLLDRTRDAIYLLNYTKTKGPWNKGNTKFIELVCPICKKQFTRKMKEYKKAKNKGSLLVCSRSCACKFGNVIRWQNTKSDAAGGE